MRLFDLTVVLANNTFGRPLVASDPSVVFFRCNLNARNNIWNGYSAALTEGQTAVGVVLGGDYNLLFNAPLGSSVPIGSHNLLTDPQFAGPASANFALKRSSPAVDSGDNPALPSEITTDLNNQPRYQDMPGVPNTATGLPPLDRGAYEAQPLNLYLAYIAR